jgi:hypothetical protein
MTDAARAAQAARRAAARAEQQRVRAEAEDAPLKREEWMSVIPDAGLISEYADHMKGRKFQPGKSGAMVRFAACECALICLFFLFIRRTPRPRVTHACVS